MIVLRPSPDGVPQRADILVPVRGYAQVDFGAGSSVARTVVTGQSGITGQSVVMAQVAIVATADHSADEHLVEGLSVYAGDVVPGVGFTVFARTDNLPLRGRFNVSWCWS